MGERNNRLAFLLLTRVRHLLTPRVLWLACLIPEGGGCFFTQTPCPKGEHSLKYTWLWPDVPNGTVTTIPPSLPALGAMLNIFLQHELVFRRRKPKPSYQRDLKTCAARRQQPGHTESWRPAQPPPPHLDLSHPGSGRGGRWGGRPGTKRSLLTQVMLLAGLLYQAESWRETRRGVGDTP